jgi:hypothetical protein
MNECMNVGETTHMTRATSILEVALRGKFRTEKEETP